MAFTTEQIRNVALAGHPGAGKTLLFDALLHAGGAIAATGSLQRGTTTSDFDPIEKERGHSLDSAIASVDHGGIRLNLVDTPGYPDFRGPALSALAAVETVAIVVDPDDAASYGTRRMMAHAKARKLCRMLVVNKLDHGGAGSGGAGLVNGALLLVTVLTQLLVPAALRRWGWGPVLVVGMVLLGAPAALLLLSDALAPVLLWSAVRGVGFGVLTVIGAAAVAALVDPARRHPVEGAVLDAIGVRNDVQLRRRVVLLERVVLSIAIATLVQQLNLRLDHGARARIARRVAVRGRHATRPAGRRAPHNHLARAGTQRDIPKWR